jgi:hypothetical protein
MMEAISFSETSVLKRATRRNIPEVAIFIVTAVKTSNLTKLKIFSDRNRSITHARDSRPWSLMHSGPVPEGTNDTGRREVMNDRYEEPVQDKRLQKLLAPPSFSMSVRLLQSDNLIKPSTGLIRDS